MIIIIWLSLNSHSMFLNLPVLLLSATSRSPFSNASLLLYANLQAKLLESGAGDREGQRRKMGRFSFPIGSATWLYLRHSCIIPAANTEEGAKNTLLQWEKTVRCPLLSTRQVTYEAFQWFFFNGFTVRKINLVLFSPVEIKYKHLSEIMSLENDHMPEES